MATHERIYKLKKLERIYLSTRVLMRQTLNEIVDLSPRGLIRLTMNEYDLPNHKRNNKYHNE